MNSLYQFPCYAARALLVLSMAVSLTDVGRVQAQESPRFEQVEEGLLDTQTGLVWGHNLYDVEFFTSGQFNGRNWDLAMSMLIRDDRDGDGVIEWITYQEFSNAFYGRNDNDWRVPTRDELVEAINAGLMLELDLSPEEGAQLFDPETRHAWTWSSTPGGKKRGGFDSAYRVNLITGEFETLTVGSLQHNTIPVRGAAPPSGGKPGKGGGNK